MNKQAWLALVWLAVAAGGLVVLPALTLLAAPAAQSTPCAEFYTVQADDWLSKIADKFLGDALAYPAIFEATNQQHQLDAAFAQIENPDLIKAGWQLCIPATNAARELLAQTAVSTETAPLEPAEITVFAAASLTESFTEIGQIFEAANPGVRVIFNFAGSQQLSQQLNQGAQADVFASANSAQMDVAIEAGRVISGTQQLFVRNRLVVVYPADNPTGLLQLQDLSNPGLRLILAAEEVPVGRYSQQFLARAAQEPAFGAAFQTAVLNNVVSFEQNVKAVLTKVSLGEGDAGIVYTSDVTPDVSNQVGQLEIPDNLNTIASYPIAPVNDAAHPVQAGAFVDYVLSPAGQQVLAKYGFIPVSK